MADMIETPTGQFNPDVRYTDDPEIEKLLQEPIGKFGSMWHEWMKLNHPTMKVLYITGCKWQIIPREVDKKAAQRYDELEIIYDRDNPRPDTGDFNVLRKWEEAKKLWIEHIIIEEIVNVVYPFED